MNAAFILQIGLAFSFLYSGISILKSEDKWIHMPLPWVRRVLSPPILRQAMMLTGIFDIAVGVWLVTPFLTWLAVLVASAHLVTVLLVSGINHETYRDVGLLAASIALFLLLQKPAF